MIAHAVSPLSLGAQAERMTRDFMSLLALEGAGAAVVLWRVGRSEVLHAHGVSTDILEALESLGAECLDGLTHRTVQPVRIPVSQLPDEPGGLRDVLRRSGLAELAVLPLDGERGQAGAIVVPLTEGDAARVDVTDANWRLVSRGLDRVRLGAMCAALRAAAAADRRGAVELPQAATVIDSEGRVVLASGFLARQPGWEAPIGRLLDELPHARTLLSVGAGEGPIANWVPRKLTMAGGKVHEVEVARLTTRPGTSPEWGDARVFLVRHPEASPPGETGRERLLELVLRASTAADRLSHAVRLSGSERSTLVTAVRREASGALEVLDEVMSRGSDADPAPFLDVNEAVEAVVETSAEDLDLEGIRVFRFPSPDLPRVPGEATLVHRALQILVDAARDSMRPAGGTLTIRTRTEDGWVIAVVSDDGKGHGDRAPTLGTPLFEDPADELPAALANVEELVSRLGGKLESESRPGLWTRVTLFFREGRADESRRDRQPGQRADRPLRVLVVDDNAALRSVLRRCLEVRGHSVVEATDGAEGLRAARETPDVDRILVDVQMPVKNGIELYLELDDVAPGLKERVIFVTGGFTELESRDVVEGAGRPVLQKPFDLRYMVEAIEAD